MELPGASAERAAAVPALGKRARATEPAEGPAVAAEPTPSASFTAPPSTTATAEPDVGPAEEQVELDEPPLNSRDHYRLRKRVPLRRESNRCDVYVTRSARFRALQARCIALLDARRSPVVHALGAAIGRACDLALAVQAEARGEVVLAVRTDTVVVYDDYEPLVPGLPSVTKERSKSAVHITITPTKDYI